MVNTVILIKLVRLESNLNLIWHTSFTKNGQQLILAAIGIIVVGESRDIWFGRWGFIDTNGNYVVEPQYDEAWPFSEGLAAVYVGEKYGYYDRVGKPLTEPRFTYADEFFEGLALVEVNGRWGFIDTLGKTIIEPQFEDAERFSNVV